MKKRVLVTGASRGIGKAIAEACAADGAFVGVGYKTSREAAEELAARIGGVARAIDVADPASIEAAVAAFGQVDALVANAAMHVGGLLATADPTALRELVLANVLGPLACARAVLPSMLAQKKGVILFVGSIAASRPARGQAAYAATKGSLEALTRAIAVEYGRKGIRALCIRPGAVATDMLETTRSMAEDEIVARIPLRRIADPVEIAKVARHLLSDDAQYMNGAVIDVDGGYAVA